MNYFINILNSKISLLIIGYEMSLGKKEYYLILKIKYILKKRK